MRVLKTLNLYAGIGGNRKLWTDVQVTAVELEPKIAAIYQSFFPDDAVIVGDGHQYLLDHYQEFDFIWASPPCPTHSGVNNFLNPQGIIRYPDMKLWQEIIFLEHFCKGKYCIENVKSYYEPFLKPQISGRHYFWANFKIPNLKTNATVGRMGPAGTKIPLQKLQSDIGRFGPVKSLDGKCTEGMRDESLGFEIKDSHKPGKRLVQTYKDIPGFGLKDLKENFDNIQMNIPKKQWQAGGSSLSRKMLNNCCHPDIGLAILNAARGIITETKSLQVNLFNQQP